MCALVLEGGGNEDQAIAALLHDAVEDQGGLATLEAIRHRFGHQVADTVASCSDSTERGPTQKPPWRERKEKYLAHLRRAKQNVLLVATADKLYNARATLLDHRQVGDKVFKRFSAPKADQLWYYSSLVKVLKKTAAPKRLVDELARTVAELKELVS